MKKPIIAITMGDPFGNGAEITVKALNNQMIYSKCNPLVVGDEECMKYAIEVQKKINNIDLRLNVINDVDEARFEYGVIDLLNLGLMKGDKRFIFNEKEVAKPFNVMSCIEGGEAGFKYVEKVIKLALDKRVDATVTNAVSKEAINLAGYKYSGHTEIYADLTDTKNYCMVLAHENLRVIHVSTHVSLIEACNRVKKQRVLECIRLANSFCKEIGIKNPKIGVAGLNPHAGENGMFGREELEEIQPAITQALSEGVNIVEKTPIPPDTVFSKAIGGWYDMVVVMYHDQGHIPLKIKGFEYDKEKQKWKSVSGVNITYGLPIIRTSVDHGTGFDHAGSGVANSASLVNAIEYAVQLSKKDGDSYE